jgi:hypothetical protein
MTDGDLMAMFEAFLDGVTAAGLFRKLNWPGARTELIDSRTPEQFNAKEAAISLESQSLRYVRPDSRHVSPTSQIGNKRA